MHLINAFKVLQPGPFTTLQDAGRFGVRHLGISQGGAIDLYSWAWANYLVGNAWGAAALEITFGGLKLQACHDLYLALSGAELGAEIDGHSVEPWTTVCIHRGQILSFNQPRNGLRAYLAIAGGFQGKPLLGSLATVYREQLGGPQGDGQPLAAGDHLQAQAVYSSTQPQAAKIPSIERPDYSQPVMLDCIIGAQADAFSATSLFNFFNHKWTIDNHSDRMGIRLNGPLLSCSISNLISEGLTLGAIQVPPNGQPIILMNDRQTIGGYPRLGNITPLSCARLAQCLPGQHINFRAIPLETAFRQHLRFLRQFGQVK
ncbi:biotin-dependent carboxyltransferase family protein [Denitrificimonas sp. JX-1]|uniref:Biotin-dependent carboxyltransferase family protein n=2 Tax=Denitrificimonas halotolerans TaxID=3098930 RepID=A0ABU5GMS2_9GAMM|nr:biotin-dependent carboxyltransferase family protein [Denitrificimonas sp. JX-1]MDY7218253.1 biotin-dependent carboxyltransferase family protein [Denitrificimonas sp. JX-1]